MDKRTDSKVSIKAVINAPLEKVWKYWTEPDHITMWNHASDDWHSPFAENDLKAGGKFLSRMEARDGSFGFDFTGVYDEVRLYEHIAYTLEDGRKVKIDFIAREGNTEIMESFDAETTNSIKQQQQGWQAILDNFKKYTEGLCKSN
ncbi:SRPBCC family protein [Lacrimispora sp.]|uniref:SRPBCC family protein n=1 Tax=Lacrimispora sp. TaxID=2719234 RepID=UPI0028B165C5|nr:SRPBCC family protein [Lacrimispora sp.]